MDPKGIASKFGGLKSRPRRQLPPKEESVNLASFQLKPTPKKKSQAEKKEDEEGSASLKFEGNDLSSGGVEIGSLEKSERKTSLKTTKKQTIETTVDGVTRRDSSVIEESSSTTESSRRGSAAGPAGQKKRTSISKEPAEPEEPTKKIFKKRRILPKQEDDKKEIVSLKPTEKKKKAEEEEQIDEVSTNIKHRGSDVGTGGVEIGSLEVPKFKEGGDGSRRESMNIEESSSSTEATRKNSATGLKKRTISIPKEAAEPEPPAKIVKKKRTILPKKEDEKQQAVSLKPTPKKKGEKAEEVVDEVSTDIKHKGSDISTGGVDVNLEVPKLRTEEPEVGNDILFIRVI